MQIEEVKEHLRKLGYTVSAHSADGTYYFSNISEAIDLGLIPTHIEVVRDISGQYTNMQISSRVGLFTLSSGWVSIKHDKFELWFKNRLEYLTDRLESAEVRYKRNYLECK